MAGQSDAADDLISELAKLMAQDAKPERPQETAFPAFSVRIPGGDDPAPKPRFDFDSASRPAPAPAQPAPTTPVAPAVPAAAAPAATSKPAPTEQPEPFHFDFDIAGSRSAATPAPAQGPASPVAPGSEQSVAPALAAESTVDHDSIADLIAAELSGVQSQAEPKPVPTPAAAPVVSATPEPRPAPPPGNWAPTPAAPASGGQDHPERAPFRPVDLPQATRPEQDKFKVPPVFGLGSNPVSPEPSISPVVSRPPVAPRETAPVMRQPAPPPSVDPAPPSRDDDSLGSDPIDEIESLIGRAMRVEFEPASEVEPASERPAPSPALRSLATPVMATPAPSAPSSGSSRALSGADEAILAAAQATGAQIGWVDTPEVSDLETATDSVSPRRLRRPALSRAVVGPLVALTLLLAAGFGLYWVLGLSRETGPAPLLTADTAPIKETPEVQPNATTTQQSVVFNEIDGVVPGADEQLVSRDQADLNEVTQVPPPVAELSEEGLANRKVRTVTVRPDGTIVSGEDSVAGSAILPVDRPNVPTVPGAVAANPELLAATTPEPTPTTPAATPAETPVPAPAAPTVTPVTPGTIVPAVDAAGNVLAGKTAPVPMARPTGLQGTAPSVPSPVTAVVSTPATASGNMLPPPPANSTLGNLPAAQPVATTPAAQPAAAIPGAVEVQAIANSAPAYAQLASLRTEAEARQAAQSLVNRFGPLFGGANMEVQRVDLGARGIYYRVRVPAGSAQAANSICANVVSAGGECVPM